ncbi:MAG: glycosyltransferase [Candidatus Hydrogenedentes bacterium]|nr:glycosyltransferase [Candidatus Hydrogenedentota bacterium]
MNVLLIGRAFGMIGDSRSFLDCNGAHAIRTLAPRGDPADYHFAPGQSALEIIDMIACDWRPDLVLNWLPELCPPPLGIEDIPYRTAAVISDWNLYAPAFHHNLARYDVIVCDKPGSLQYRPWGATPRYHAPLYGYHPRDHRNLGIPRDIDVLFIGNLNPAIHQKRARLLEALRALGGPYRVEILSGLWGDAYAQALNRARIVFNHSIRGEMNLRAFEAPACGALLLQETENLEIREYLATGREVVLYTDDTLRDTVTHLLDHEAERATIAQAGHERMLQLAPAPRFDALAACIMSLAPQPRRFFDLPDALRAAASLMQQGASANAGQRQAAQRRAAVLAAAHEESPEVLAAAAGVTFNAAQESGAITQDDLGQVLAWLKQALAHAPDSAPLWHNLANMCAIGGRPDIADRCFRRVLEAGDLTAAPMLFGNYQDPRFIHWLGALARDEARADLVHAIAQARVSGLEAGEGG